MIAVLRLCLAGLTMVACASSAWAQSVTCASIQTGDIVVDPPTFLSLGFSLPILAGDGDYDAAVAVEYRQAGTLPWKQALPLMRVRPETVSDITVAEQFAGSIMNLQPDTAYEVRFRLVDPDGCDETIQITTSTRAEPPLEPANPNYINVNSIDELNAAANAAAPGDVIILANGVHVATHGNDAAIRINDRHGTFLNPIVIRGETRGSAIIDANGKDEGIYTYQSDFIHIEDLVIKNAVVGIRLAFDTTGSVVRGNTLRDVTKGIYARHYIKRDITICDNDLQGGVVFPDTDNSTWNFEGIVVSGEGHVICYNTIGGFGDSLGFFASNQGYPIRSIDIYGNDVLWGGDDCIEFDYGERNLRAFNNRCMNTGNGISTQPVYGGPVYAIRNIIYNIQRTKQIKIANDPSGMLYYNNLFGLRATNSQDNAFNVDIRNNLWIGSPQQSVINFSNFDLFGPSTSDPPIIDYNGYSYDGRFSFGDNLGGTHNNLAELQAETSLETHGIILTDPIFINTIPVLANQSGIFVDPIDPSLHPNSNALNAGTVLANVTDGYTGSAPDLGPYEFGEPLRHYGVRWNAPPPDDTPPSPPQNLSATAQGATEIDLTWSAATDPESGISRYYVFRDGTFLDQSTTTDFSDTDLTPGASYTYEVSAINGAGLQSGHSDPVSVTTPADATAPTIVSVETSAVPTELTVVFSEPVEQGSATTTSNYSIDNAIAVQSASLAADLVTVTLTTSTLAPDLTYTLTVSNVTDLAAAPNSIAPGSTATFVFLDVTVVEVKIPTSGDDVEESSSGSINTTSGDLELAVVGSDSQIIGLRFVPVVIPQGATITKAYVQFRTDEVTVALAALLVEGQATDNAAPFGASVSTLPRTAASASWIPAPWSTTGEQGPDQRTSDIAAVVQEVVNRPGWQSGNALVLIITGSGTRTAESKDGSDNGAPLLHVEYLTVGSATEPPQAPTGLDVE